MVKNEAGLCWYEKLYLKHNIKIEHHKNQKKAEIICTNTYTHAYSCGYLYMCVCVAKVMARTLLEVY